MEKNVIIIDTNIFGKPNRYDFENGLITVLLKAFKSIINFDIYIPSLVIDEIKRHIKDSLTFDFFESKSKYFKDNISTEKLCEEIIQKVFNEFDEFIKLYNIKILDCYKYMNIEEVNNWYFNMEMPFEVTKPKEFPDAMIISAIINFLSKSSYKDVYIISDDNGFQKGIENHSEFKVYNTIGSVMCEILDYNDTDLVTIKKYITRSNILYSLDLINFYSAGDDVRIEVSINDYCIKEIEIINVDNNRYDLNVTYDAKVSGDICILDPYQTLYDRENSQYYKVFKNTDKLELKDVSTFFSVYKNENGKFYGYESIMPADVDLTKYLDKMNLYYCI